MTVFSNYSEELKMTEAKECPSVPLLLQLLQGFY